MANSQGGQGQSQGQGGHGQTFTAAQHDTALGRESQGPSTKHDTGSREVVEGAESTIDVPEDSRGFAAGEEAGGDLEQDDAGAAMEPQVDTANGQGIVGGS